MISEKDKRIVDAVNWLKGDINNLANGFSVNQDKIIMSGRGEFFGASPFAFVDGWSKVCSMQVMLDCIREMSAGKFVTTCELTEEQVKRLYANIDEQGGLHEKPEFEYGQKVYVDIDKEGVRDWYFGCYTLKGDTCVILCDGGHMIVSVDRFSANPFKSSEEIEMEEAKRLQVLELMYFYEEAYGEEEIKYFFEVMQENGHLAEVLLPLESK